MKTVQMKTVERPRWCRSGIFISKCEHVSHFALIADFEQTFAGFILKKQTLFKASSTFNVIKIY